MKMTHDEMINVIIHHKNGSMMQFKNDDGEWLDIIDPGWNFAKYEYRAKPEPLVLWVVFSDGFRNTYKYEKVAQHVYDQLTTALPSQKITLKKFMEVAE